MSYSLHTPFYNPKKSYEENFRYGPFGALQNKKKYIQKGEPTYSLFGEKIFFPFGIGAGALPNAKFLTAALDKGFDIVVYKTVRTTSHPCNPFPNIIPLPVKGNLTITKMKKGIVPTKKYTYPLTITNSFGVPSYAPNIWQPDLKKAVAYAKKGQLIIGSFQGTINKTGKNAYIHDFAIAAKKVKSTGVKVLEVNLSCPNEGTSHLLCFDTSTTTDVVRAIKKEIGNTPLIVKLAYFADKRQLQKLMEKIYPYIQGVAATNTLSTKIINRDGSQYLPGEGRLCSGVGGKGIMWAGLEMVRSLKKMRTALRADYVIFGYGGVASPHDYAAYKKAGADVVMSVGGAIWNPYLAQEIKKEYL